MKLLKIFLATLTLVFLISACANQEETANSTNAGSNDVNANSNSATETPETAKPDPLAEGAKHYKEQCVKCHKDDGKGGEVEIEGQKLNPEDLTSAKMIKEPDSEYIEYITDGIKDEGMPAFKDVLTEDQIKLVVKFIREELQKK